MVILCTVAPLLLLQIHPSVCVKAQLIGLKEYCTGTEQVRNTYNLGDFGLVVSLFAFIN
jgi:hypothetical protein